MTTIECGRRPALRKELGGPAGSPVPATQQEREGDGAREGFVLWKQMRHVCCIIVGAASYKKSEFRNKAPEFVFIMCVL